MPEGLNKKHEDDPKVVKTKLDFVNEIADLGNQFYAIDFDIKRGLPFKTIVENLKKNTYHTFEENLKDKTLSPEIKNNDKYKRIIGVYNYLVDRIKKAKFENFDELKDIIQEAKQLKNDPLLDEGSE